MTFKEDKPTYFLYCEHLVQDKTSLRNSKYRERVKGKNENYRANWQYHDPIQIDMTRMSRGGVPFDKFYHAECPVCKKNKEI